MNSLRPILLAEDNPADVELTLEALRTAHIANEIIHLPDGEAVLDWLHARDRFADRPPGLPALLMLDLKMPKIGGLEVLQQLKSDPRLRTLPVVVLTSSREEQDVVRSYQLGVNGYVVKPVEYHCFIEAVSQLGVFWALVNEPPPNRPLADENPSS
ncbi:MAG: two-component system response regulator [Opitutus sp.]|nr:two-component system response regulator [Opitutus sp.]